MEMKIINNKTTKYERREDGDSYKNNKIIILGRNGDKYNNNMKILGRKEDEDHNNNMTII